MKNAKIDLCLVASTPDGTESLGLGYLAAALKEAGHTPHVITFRSWMQIDEAARNVCRLDPPLTGVSIPSGQAAIDVLAFVLRLRALGYKGHITCGGSFATLCRRRLLEEFPALDSVVRHDGEVPVVLLADAVGSGLAPVGLPGVTTRSGDGLPAPVADRTFMRIRPARSAFRKYAGVPSAKLSAVRGCWAGCGYCGLAALRREKTREAKRGGMTQEEMKTAGVGGIRRRPVDSVADEMAWLYHAQGVRFFHFVDENHLPRDHDHALRLLRSLDGELLRRGVGRRAVSMMLRADVATGPIVDALSGLGLVRCLLGVDSMDPENLGFLGRKGSARVNRLAVDNLSRRHICFHFNLLLVHPYSTIAMIEREVRAIGSVNAGLVDPFQVEVFEGTGLYRRLEREGRLRGGPFFWFYDIEDPAAERFARIFSLIKNHAMGRVPVTSFAYEVLGMLAVTRRLGGLGKFKGDIEERARLLTQKHNRLWISILEEIVEMSRENGGQRAGDLLERTRIEAAKLTLAFEMLQRKIETSCSKPLKSEIMLPNAAAAVSFALAVLAGGCFDSSSMSDHLDSSEETVEMIDQSEGEATQEDSVEEGCSPGDEIEEHNAIESAAHFAECRLICETVEYFKYRFVLDEGGHVVDVEREDGVPVPDEIKTCYMDAVKDQVFPCLQEHPFWETCQILLA